MKTAIMTDSNSGIKPEEAKELGIYVLPMPIIVNDETYYEGRNIEKNELYEYLESGENVSASMPSPGDVIDMWDGLLEEYDEVVYIPMSSGLSNSCGAAIQLSQEYNGKVQVVDNHRISITMYRSILDAKYLAGQGKSASEIKQILEDEGLNSSIYIAVDTLEYLKRGGRVTAAGAALGAVLNIKPVLTIQGEKLDAFAKVRGIKKAQLRMLDAIEEDLNTRFKDYDRDSLSIDTATTFLDDADDQAWFDMVAERFPDIKHRVNMNLSFSIGCHVGPNAIGIGISVLLDK